MKSILSILFLIFLTLKLIDKIDWSWWIVCTPLIVEFSIRVALAVWKEFNPLSFYRFWR